MSKGKLLKFPGAAPKKPEVPQVVGPDGTAYEAQPGPRVVFVGRAGSGKDTAANELGRGFMKMGVHEMPGGKTQPVPVWRMESSTGQPPYMQMALADPIRAGVSSMFQLNPAVLMDPEAKNEPGVPGFPDLSPRDLAVALGMGMRDRLTPDLWVELLVHRAASIQDITPDTTLAVTDCRFLNEYRVLKDAWPQRVLFIGITGRGGDVENVAESEIDEVVAKCDLTIHNGPDVTVEEFGRKVREAVLHWFPQLDGALAVDTDAQF